MVHLDTICIELTTKCTLRCIHCSANAAPERNEIFPRAILLSKLAEYGSLREIYLSGGEPFEHPEFHTILSDARKLAPKVIAYSSGIIANKKLFEPISEIRLAKAKQAGLSRIDISVYSDSAEAHDNITKTQGSLAATLETARHARRSGLGVGVHFVPIGQAAESLDRVFKLAAEIGAERFHVLALAAQGRAKSISTKVMPKSHFWQLLGYMAASPDKDMEVILSSQLRRSMGIMEHSIRDLHKSAFLDVRGYLYPGEGFRIRGVRSQNSLLSGSSLDTLLHEVVSPQRLPIVTG